MFPEKYFPNRKFTAQKSVISIDNFVGDELRSLLKSKGVVFQTRDSFEKYVLLKAKCDVYFRLIDSSDATEKTANAAKETVLVKAAEYYISHVIQ